MSKAGRKPRIIEKEVLEDLVNKGYKTADIAYKVAAREEIVRKFLKIYDLHILSEKERNLLDFQNEIEMTIMMQTMQPKRFEINHMNLNGNQYWDITNVICNSNEIESGINCEVVRVCK